MGKIFDFLKTLAFCWLLLFALMWILNRLGLFYMPADQLFKVLSWPGTYAIDLLNVFGAEILKLVWHKMIYSSVIWSVVIALSILFLRKDKHL